MLIRHIAAAASLAVTLAACGETASVTPAPAAADLKSSLWPSSWVATEIAGKPVVPGSEPTLVFDADGKVSGNGTCNRFAGPSTIEAGTLKFGALISTKMACAGEGLNEQETAYFSALSTAEKAEITLARTLQITSTGGGVTHLHPATP